MEAIKLNLVPSDLTKPICHASQYDDGREIMLMLMDGQKPYVLSDEEIELDVKKLDGNIVTTDLTVESGKNYVIMETTEQMCAIAGRNNCELKVQKDGKTIYSKNFYLAVEESATAGGIQSASEINNLETQIEGMVEDAVENQYDSENVIFDSEPTEGHGTGYTVTSAGIKAAIDAAGGGGVSPDVITDEYDATSTYAIGDMVIHENALYVCSTAITTAEAWNSAHWTLTDIATAIGTVKTAIPTKTSDLQNDSGFAQIDDTEESASKTYSSEKIESIVEGKADESEVVELSEQVDSAVKKTITDKVITTRYVRTDLTTGIKQPSGTVVTSSSSGYTPIFPVTAGETITCKKYYLNSSGELKGGVDGTFGTIVFFADNTQTYTSWGESWNASKTSFVVPANAKYCQVTITAIMSGTYTIADVIQTTANGKTNYYLQQDTFKSPVRYIGSLTANKVQAIGEKICVDNYILSATMKVPQNFSSVKVGGRKEAGYDITLPTVEVTPTQVIIHSLLGNTFDITEAHGLTIVDDLQIVIEKNKFDKAKVIIQSGGSRFTVDNVNWGLSYYGYAIVSTENVTDVVVSLSVCDLYKPVWVCGDSWVTNFDSRWYGQALKLGVANFLKSGHAGEASVDGLNDLKTLLSMYKPKMIVWLYGMNDADTNDSTPNANWLASVQEIETICREQSIELVLATIPTTPTRNNNAKNDVVIASGYRYVDEVSAMGADNSGNWIEGYQSEDGNHTTEEGAKALLVRVLADVPEIALN